MSPALLVRLSGSWWVWIVVTALTYLFVRGSIPAEATYPLASQVTAAQGMFLVGPLTALCAATSASRFRGAGVDVRPRRRSYLAIRATRLLPLVVAVFVGILLGMTIAGRSHDAVAWPDPGLCLVLLSAVIMYATLGDLLGSRLPLKVAAPIAAIVPYLLVAFPPSMSPLWLRHLFGINSTCCAVWERLAVSVVTAGMLVSAAGTVAFLALGARAHSARSRVLQLIAAGSVVVVLVAVAVNLVHERDYSAGQARASQPSCAGSGPAICTWPEHASAGRRLQSLAASTAQRARELGVPVPSRITEEPSDKVTWPDTAADFNVTLGKPLLDKQFFNALSPYLTTRCAREQDARGLADQTLAYEAAGYVVSSWWTAAVTGSVDVSAQQAPSPEAAAAAVFLLREPRAQQPVVVRAMVEAMASCSPVRLPGRSG